MRLSIVIVVISFVFAGCSVRVPDPHFAFQPKRIAVISLLGDAFTRGEKLSFSGFERYGYLPYAWGLDEYVTQVIEGHLATNPVFTSVRLPYDISKLGTLYRGPESNFISEHILDDFLTAAGSETRTVFFDHKPISDRLQILGLSTEVDTIILVTRNHFRGADGYGIAMPDDDDEPPELFFHGGIRVIRVADMEAIGWRRLNGLAHFPGVNVTDGHGLTSAQAHTIQRRIKGWIDEQTKPMLQELNLLYR